MKVYIIYCMDGYNTQEVDLVFGDRQKAINYVIENRFSHNIYYKGKSIDYLIEAANDFIHEFEVN